MISVGKSQQAVHAHSPIASTPLEIADSHLQLILQALEALESKASQLLSLPHHHFHLIQPLPSSGVISHLVWPDITK